MPKKALVIGIFLALILFLGVKVSLASEATGSLGTTLESGLQGVTKAAPTVSPAVGTYNSTQSVTLTASGSSAICYTTDGTTPACATSTTCTTGTKYTSAISVTSTTTIKSAACYSDATTGPVATSAYTLTCATSSVTNGTVSAYPSCTITCNSGYTLSGSTCIAVGGGFAGGGGGAPTTPIVAPSMPTTTTGEVTATASAGGQTTVTTVENIQATVKLPAQAVSASTEVAVASVATTEAAVSTAVAAVPAGQGMAGGYVYDFTATSAGQPVTTFSKYLTITITYTDAQIKGLKESTLAVNYWDAVNSKWVPLTTSVNRTANTLTAQTLHFTYFGILGEKGVEEEIIPAEPALVAQVKSQMILLIKQLIILIAQLITELQSQLAAIET